MEIYLPIAEQSMNVFVLFALGGAAGLLAGMFGVGGGFLATPLLIFVGIPPAVAVANAPHPPTRSARATGVQVFTTGPSILRMSIVGVAHGV